MVNKNKSNFYLIQIKFMCESVNSVIIRIILAIYLMHDIKEKQIEYYYKYINNIFHLPITI